MIAIRTTRKKRSQDILTKSTNRPHFVVDRGPWYAEIYRKLGLSYEHRRRGPRNAIESWFRHTKRRLKRFCNVFPFRTTIWTVMTFLNACGYIQRDEGFDECLS
jgi:transposase-like protein